MWRRTVFRCLLVVGILAAVATIAVRVSKREKPNTDPSVQVTEVWRSYRGVVVENGTAFDRASVDIAGYAKVILPDTAEVHHDVQVADLRLFMAKTLGFGGHPGESMSPWTVRKYMGCVSRAEPGVLIVATYGEWASIEGGTHMKLVAIVPAGVTIERRKGLSGPDSAGREWQGFNVVQAIPAKSGNSDGRDIPAAKWRVVPDAPDPEQLADK